jgi:hypothetical protein
MLGRIVSAALPHAEFGFPGPLRDPPVPIDAETLVVCTRFRVVELLQPSGRG